MTKENIIKAIKSRITTENTKHKTLDWAEIAAIKLYADIIKDLQKDAFDAGRKTYPEETHLFYTTFEDYLKTINDEIDIKKS